MVIRRDIGFDVAKFLAMFMVVYSHVVSYRLGFDHVTMPSYAMNFIQSVNMPLFFIISGYFAQHLHETRNINKLVDRLVKYFWPMIFFAVFYTMIDWLFLDKIGVLEVPALMLKKFLFCGWFFYSLAICDIITYLVCKYGNVGSRRLFACGIGFLMLLFTSGICWYSAPAVAMIPFYWFGLWVLPFLLSKPKFLANIAILGGGVMFLVTFLLGNIATNGLSFYLNRFDVLHPDMRDFLLMVARYVIGILGSIFVMELVKLGMKCVPLFGKLAVFGTETLGIYFLQGNIIHNVVTHYIRLDASVIEILVASCLVYLLSFFFVKITKINHSVYIAVWGKGH